MRALCDLLIQYKALYEATYREVRKPPHPAGGGGAAPAPLSPETVTPDRPDHHHHGGMGTLEKAFSLLPPPCTARSYLSADFREHAANTTGGWRWLFVGGTVLLMVYLSRHTWKSGI